MRASVKEGILGGEWLNVKGILGISLKLHYFFAPLIVSVIAVILTKTRSYFHILLRRLRRDWRLVISSAAIFLSFLLSTLAFNLKTAHAEPDFEKLIFFGSLANIVLVFFLYGWVFVIITGDYYSPEPFFNMLSLQDLLTVIENTGYARDYENLNYAFQVFRKRKADTEITEQEIARLVEVFTISDFTDGLRQLPDLINRATLSSQEDEERLLNQIRTVAFYLLRRNYLREMEGLLLSLSSIYHHTDEINVKQKAQKIVEEIRDEAERLGLAEELSRLIRKVAGELL